MRLSSILSDGMVLQRNSAVPLWGMTGADQTVQIFFNEKEYSIQSDSGGVWRTTLKEMEAGGPYEMRLLSGDQEVVIRDILIGDVWVLGGQSNMELPIRRTLDLLADEVKQVNLPLIRQFAVPQTYNFHAPQQELSGGQWIAATQEHILNFSAAGFFFAREIQERYGVPVGLIHAAVGGTPVEAWISEPTLRGLGGYEDILDQCKDDNYVTGTKVKEEERNQAWYGRLNETDLGLKEGWFRDAWDTSDWEDFVVPGSWSGSELESLRGTVWFRKEFEVPASLAESEVLLKLGTIVDADDTYINGVCIGNTGYMYPPRRYPVPEGLLKPGVNSIAVRVISTHSTGAFIKDMPYKLVADGQELDLEGVWKYRIGTVTEAMQPQTFFQYMPSGVYNSMISPLRNYVIKGALWYQGESNAGQPAGYSEKFAAMVGDWRRNWDIGEFPFIFTQLANLGEADGPQTDWAELREEQRKGLRIPGTAMAVTYDIGEYNDLHPQDKKSVGQRLALGARKVAYGEESLVYSGPLFHLMERSGNSLILHFDQTGTGLTVRNGDSELRGFEVCGPDGTFVPAKAAISGNTVIVTHDKIDQPSHARYAWSNNPAKANLYNREGLPASPFTTETPV
ncbi:sialate O-acetylesterase [Paenibacillus sp. FSL R5-0407]|uniref:sialate O-acetylesterase n=1 Tax=Paenibacillus sp. FSL R5-0407 TaxID=2975320 RepID=UPI0030F542EC